MRKILKCRAIFYWQIYVIKIKWKNNNSEKLTLFYGSYRDTIYFRHFVYVYDWYTKLDSFIPKSPTVLGSEGSFCISWFSFAYFYGNPRRCKYHCKL